MKRFFGLLLIAFMFMSLFACTAKREAQTKQPNTPRQQSVKQQQSSAPQPIETKEPPSETPDHQKMRQKADGSAQKVILDVPLIAQNPELKYGCEVTSLAMLLKYAGVKTNKMKLADEIKKDADPIAKAGDGNIVRWGDPKDGFVGDISGNRAGYAVFAGPMEKLMKRYLPGRTLNLTGQSFDELLAQVKNKKPVVVWTTGDYRLPDRWESWLHGNERIKVPLDLHAVVIVGYDPDHVYLNDPLSVKKAHKVDKAMFIKSWNALGKQALSYK